jgi:hypothetical protein
MASLAAALSVQSPGSDISSQRETARPPAIAVIGAGFSGTLLALHLLQRCPPSVRIHLIERSPQFGRGLAYSTGNPNHVLNVPAGRMSAFHNRPDDFFQWLQQNHEPNSVPVTPSSFVSRSVFGDYIRYHPERRISPRFGSWRTSGIDPGRGRRFADLS